VAGDELVPRPTRGRVFAATERVRLADLSRAGRLRLDAIARLLQDVASDDADDAGQEPDRAWVVRRLVVELDTAARSPRLRADIGLATWCSGSGPRWAERRTDIAYDGALVVRAAAIWVLVDVATGRPQPLGAPFEAVYGEAAGGRRVSPRLRHAPPPPGADVAPWPLRVTDFDVLGHVNNAAYWMPVEEALARLAPKRRVARAEIEFRDGIEPGETVDVAEVMDASSGAGRLRCWLTVAGAVRASVVVDLAPTE
jgi:acyl-ACP thioesterase